MARCVVSVVDCCACITLEAKINIEAAGIGGRSDSFHEEFDRRFAQRNCLSQYRVRGTEVLIKSVTGE
jgi:hypothetical protein